MLSFFVRIHHQPRFSPVSPNSPSSLQQPSPPANSFDSSLRFFYRSTPSNSFLPSVASSLFLHFFTLAEISPVFATLTENHRHTPLQSFSSSRLALTAHPLGATLFNSKMAPTLAPTRISRRFAALRSAGDMGIVAYITAGDPSFDATLKFVIAMAEAGADLIELGVPFSDPLADGPTIQRASERALKNGATLAGVIELVHSIRKSDSAASEIPIVLFSYYNPVFQMGLEKFAAAASAAGADGVLITDLTPEESEVYRATLHAHHLNTIFLAAPTSDEARLQTISAASTGFLYLISRTGVTGEKDSLADDLPTLIRRVRRSTDLPIAVGFGISLPGHVSVLGGLADAAVVGSALVSEIEKFTAADASSSAISNAANALAARIRSLKLAANTGLSRREVAI